MLQGMAGREGDGVSMEDDGSYMSENYGGYNSAEDGGFLGYDDEDDASGLAGFIGAALDEDQYECASEGGERQNVNALALSALPPRLLQPAAAGTPSSHEHVKAVFAKFDTDGSGDLDTFELANAVAALVGRSPSTSQVLAMVQAAGVGDKNTLSLDDFERLVHTFDWDEDEADTASTGLGPSVYELEFGEQKLGFRVRNVAERGIIVVSQVSSPIIMGLVGVEDTVLAINGAPLGYVTDHQVLAQKIGSLGRPVRITFSRFRADDRIVLQTTVADAAAAKAARALGVMDDYMANTPRKMTDVQIREVFTRFDRDASGDLSTFELGNVVAALLGRPATTREIRAIVEEAAGTEGSSSLTLDQFSAFVRNFDWDAEDLRGAHPGNLFEHTFAHEKLGFGFEAHEGGGVVTVSKVTARSLDGVLRLGDKLVAINGAPIGVVDDPKVSCLNLD